MTTPTDPPPDYRGKAMKRIAAALRDDAGHYKTEQGRQDNLHALICVTGTIFAAKELLPPGPVFQDLANVIIEAMNKFAADYRNRN